MTADERRRRVEHGLLGAVQVSNRPVEQHTLADRMAQYIGLDAERPIHETLSDREYRVMWLLAPGKQINEIGKEMFLSPSTISTYRLRILRKLQ